MPVRNRAISKRSSSDSDEIQLLDECNSEWVDVWKAAANQKTELEVHVDTRAKQQIRPNITKKHR